MGDVDWPTTVQKSLAGYLQAYIVEFNALRGNLQRAGLPASLYAQELGAAYAWLASDGGVAVGYLGRPTSAKAGIEEGVYLEDRGHRTLTHVTQLQTANLLKVTITNAGSDIGTPPAIPEDLPKEECRGGINPEALQPYLELSSGLTLTGLAVGPFWHVENGIRTRMLPTRARVFSPILKVPPDDRPLLQFIFPFLDLIWLLDDLQLTPEHAAAMAKADIEVLLLGIAAGIPQKELAEDPFEAVAAHCERTCDEFFHLIDHPTTKEREVQAYLELPPHQFLIAPHCQAVFPRKPLGGNRFVPDFTVHLPDGDYQFIEIESPNTSIYQAKGQEPTAGFSHAIQQVEDWLRYVEENLLSVRNEDGLPTVYKPSGEVIVGRDKHMTDRAAKRFRFKRSETPRLSFKTYDMVITEGRAYASSLRRMKVMPQISQGNS